MHRCSSLLDGQVLEKSQHDRFSLPLGKCVERSLEHRDLFLPLEFTSDVLVLRKTRNAWRCGCFVVVQIELPRLSLSTCLADDVQCDSQRPRAKLALAPEAEQLPQ